MTIHQSRNKISFPIVLMIIALVVDMTLSTFSDILNKQSGSLWGIILFVAIVVAIFGIGQHFLLVFLNQLSRQVRSKESYLNKLYRILTMTQYVNSNNPH